MPNLSFNTPNVSGLSQITKSFAILAFFVGIWFLPATHPLCVDYDYQVFAILNQSLLHSHTAQLFWGYLNHPNETWINIIFMLAINMLAVFTCPKPERKRAFLLVIYCWLSFQIILYVTHKVFCDWLQVNRFSPSIVIKPWVILSETLNHPDIKVYSHSSFPAGHVLVLFYWLQFIALYNKNWVYKLAIFTTILLTLPRMISGAHWLSDIIFTIVYAYVWFYIAISVPLFKKIAANNSYRLQGVLS